jgi:hypothetical protein
LLASWPCPLSPTCIIPSSTLVITSLGTREKSRRLPLSQEPYLNHICKNPFYHARSIPQVLRTGTFIPPATRAQCACTNLTLRSYTHHLAALLSCRLRFRRPGVLTNIQVTLIIQGQGHVESQETRRGKRNFFMHRD